MMETESCEIDGPETHEDIYLKEFIQKLESLPVLWNSKNEHYTNKLQRHRAYASLVAIYRKIKPKATVVDVRKKINTLRSNFRRKLRQIKNSEDPFEEGYKSKSWIFQSLQFLKESSQDILNDDDTEKPARPDQQYSVVQIEVKEELETEVSEDICEEHLEVRSYSSSADEETITLPSKKVKHESISKRTDLNQKTNSYKPQPVKEQSSSHPHIDPTALYWSEKIRGLSEMQRIFAEKAINDVLFEAALGNLRKNSVQINESTISVDPISNL